ncbi:MAG: fimbrillin family protein [Tannerellaceae bacterium]|jgi:hypothetical protein|nr:fimbrillin family protein [Tannerellaceae bacterium]
MNDKNVSQAMHHHPHVMFRWVPVLAAALLLTGCVQEETAPDSDGATHVPVRFSAGIGIETRVSNPEGDQWEVADTIGIYMVNAGKALADSMIREKAKNKPYIISSGDGTNTAAFVEATDTVFYPNGVDVNFIAYYPYSADQVSPDFNYPIDISDQRDPSRLDLLYSNDKEVYNSKKNNAVLPFEHLMTRVVFDALRVAGSNASLANLQLEIQNLNTATTFDLSDGMPASDGFGQELVIPFTRYVSDDSVRMEATLIPTNNAAGIQLFFMLNGKAYAAQLPTANLGPDLLKGKRYTYKVLFDEAEVILKGQLSPWNEEPGDSITPTPDAVLSSYLHIHSGKLK